MKTKKEEKKTSTTKNIALIQKQKTKSVLHDNTEGKI